MSKEREAFDRHFDIPPALRRDSGVYRLDVYQNMWLGYQAATAHYPPQLEAKDAEIATLKALLEQAREAFIELYGEAQKLKCGCSGFPDSLLDVRHHCIPHDMAILIKQTLAAINAATGEK